MNIIQTLNCRTAEETKQLLSEFSNTAVDTIRINMSKFDFSNSDDVDNVRLLSKLMSQNSSHFDFFIDLPYPKNKARIIDMRIAENKILEKQKYIVTTYPEVFRSHGNSILVSHTDVQRSREIFFYGDGEGAFNVVQEEKDFYLVEARNSFQAYLQKSINVGFKQFKGENFQIISEIIEENPNLTVGLSFVETAKEVEEFKKSISPKEVNIVSKIETQLGIDNVDNIAQSSYGLLVARGDILLDIDPVELYDVSRYLSDVSVKHAKKLYFATDIFPMFTGGVLPNRAELMDFLLIKSLQCTDIILPYRMSQGITCMLNKVSLVASLI